MASNPEALERLARKYETFYQQSGDAEAELDEAGLEKIRPKLEYLILRLAFIYPVHLPVMTETYLRKDFHFAMYLCYCYGQVLVKFFKWSLFSVSILAGIIIFVNLLFAIMAEPMID